MVKKGKKEKRMTSVQTDVDRGQEEKEKGGSRRGAK